MRWAAMLRGINLGKRQLKSAELKGVVEGLGFTDVRTLLASGNVVFTAPGRDAAGLEAEIHHALKEETGLESEVFVRTKDQLDAVVAANPYPDVARERPASLVVMFHRDDILAAPLDRIAKCYDGPERLHRHGRDLFIDFPDGQARSNLGPAMARAKFPRASTARNWNTLLKIRDAL
ncbi:DUF1697 domain-containing protein [Sphingomonas sp.]|uniref:DUF1697 domain-containing protein n=1 Tax=Sphingomonas sp. TaxID=28214 RepID=UPI001EB1268C|nr:DUF1697 domain-containing protein [Sphingomonas sp.]MBX3593597.1 DUF1697 domain-containing protein [Sphingomonas sp.]